MHPRFTWYEINIAAVDNPYFSAMPANSGSLRRGEADTSVKKSPELKS